MFANIGRSSLRQNGLGALFLPSRRLVTQKGFTDLTWNWSRSTARVRSVERVGQQILWSKAQIARPSWSQKQMMHSAAAQMKKKTNKYIGLVQKYGVIVVVFHTLVWALVLLAVFIALHHDEFDIDWVLDKMLPSSMDSRKEKLLDAAHSEYGKFAIAYAITFATGPPRLGISLVATPWLARKITALNNPYLNKLLVHNELLENLLTNPLALFKRSKKQ